MCDSPHYVHTILATALLVGNWCYFHLVHVRIPLYFPMSSVKGSHSEMPFMMYVYLWFIGYIWVIHKVCSLVLAQNIMLAPYWCYCAVLFKHLDLYRSTIFPSFGSGGQRTCYLRYLHSNQIYSLEITWLLLQSAVSIMQSLPDIVWNQLEFCH